MTGEQRTAAVIGAALDLGAGRRGVDMGPSAVRYAQLADTLRGLGWAVADRGNVGAWTPEAVAVGDPHARFWDVIRATCEELSGLVAEAVGAGELPIVLGGDHSIAIGTLGGLRRAHGGPGGVIWIDAHADMNTPATSPSGNVHGMPLAVALGLVDDPRFASDAWPTPMVAPERTVLVGLRSVDEHERRTLREAGVTAFTMHEIDLRGIAAVIDEALQIAGGGAFLHVSLDLDALDPVHAPGVGTPVPGGLTYREAHLAVELLARAGAVASLELVEVNPILDTANATARLAVELAASALGGRIL